MPITIPTETVDREVGGGADFVPPPGIYLGTLEEARTNSFPEWAADPTNNGFDSPEGETLSLQFGQISPLDVSEDVEIGQRKLFAPNDRNNYVLRDGDNDLSNIDPTNTEVPFWKLVQTASDIGKLARALGAATNSGGGLQVPDSFVDDLVAGVFSGQEVQLKIEHLGTFGPNDERVDWRIVNYFAP